MRNRCTVPGTSPKRFYVVVALPLMLVAATSCSDGSKHRKEAVENANRDHLPQIRDSAPDIRDGWRWTDTEVEALTRRANSGDMEAADRLLQYYSVHENYPKTAYWEDWLFKRGDPGARSLRAQQLYSTARRRDNNDPRKLSELREAGRLYFSLPPERIGIYDYFLNNVKAELAAIGKSRLQASPD